MQCLFPTALIFVYFLLNVSASKGIRKRCASISESGCKVIETKLGKISGVQLKTVFGGKPFCGYLGIRFGIPPVGDLRFKAPVASGPWKGTLNATSYAPACIQTSGKNAALLLQSEDCLFLNVFVPDAKVCEGKTHRIPVIFHIIGGAFTEGSARKYGPELVMNRCVIFVTFSYRVGIFGFLPLGLPQYSGNMALKDQQLAMQWVKKNIVAFGGDSNRILVFGSSVGGASAGFHILNKKSRRLFNRVYSLGGSVLNYYSQMNTNDLRPELRAESDILRANLTTDKQLVDALKTIPTSVWLDYSFINGSTVRTRVPTWAPVIENEDAIDPFITRDPLDIYRSMHDSCNELPATVYTHQTLEMITFAQSTIDNPSSIEDLNTNFYLRLPFRGFNQDGCAEEVKPLLNEIREFYFGKSVINGEKIVEYVRMLTYMNFIYFIQKDVVIRAQIGGCPQRLQIDNQKTPLNKYGASDPAIAALPGPAHGEDLCYLVYCEDYASLYKSVEKNRNSSLEYMNAYKTSKEMIDILVSFASTGNPVSKTANLSKFPRIGRNPLQILPYIEIMNDGNIITGVNPANAEFNLWRSIDLRVQQLKSSACNQ